MMSDVRAAIYARKSTDQVGVRDDERSVARQVDQARAYAAQKGWTVADEHVYVDDAVSGAETHKLVNRQRLLETIRAGAPFQVLILRDTSRFSRRDGDEAFGELKAIDRAGVEVWFYQDGTRFTHGTFGDNVVGFVKAEAAADYRRQIAVWTRGAMEQKARRGYVTGGRCFGYDNVRVEGHVERRVNEAEAAVVRRIFELYVEGAGQSRIAKRLNEEGAVAPRSQQGRPCGWAPSSVHEVLDRSLYVGRVVWNRTRKRDQSGQRHQQARPEAEWLAVDVPALRIVPEPLWERAQARRATRRAQYLTATGGKRYGRPRRDVDSKYLLPGFARCATCGGGMCVRSRSHGGHRRYLYGCTSYWKRGRTVCPNCLEIGMGDADDAVLAAVAGVVLAPEIVDEVVAGVVTALGPDGVDRAGRRRQRERDKREAEVRRLTDAIEAGGELTSLVDRLKQRHTELDVLNAECDRVVERIPVDPRILERAVRTCLGDWRGLLARQSRHGRQFLRTVLTGPIAFTPLTDGPPKGYRFEGEASLGQLLSGVVELPTIRASPTGFEPVSQP